MEIYILRHGIAESQAPGGSDARRALTDQGRAKLRLVLDRARLANVSPSLILTSPYVRATQTAELAAEILGYGKAVVRTDALLPSSSAAAVWRELCNHGGERAVLVAGHEPLLSESASYLLGSERVIVEIKKGSLLSIEIEKLNREPAGVLKWMLTPRLAASSTQ